MYMSKSSHIVEWCLMNKRTIFHSFKNQRKMFPDVCSRPLLGVLRRRRTSAVVVVSCPFWIAKSCLRHLRQWTIQMTGGLFCRGFYALPPVHNVHPTNNYYQHHHGHKQWCHLAMAMASWQECRSDCQASAISETWRPWFLLFARSCLTDRSPWLS